MCRQRWGEHPAAEGLPKPPIPHLALLLPPPCCPPEQWTLLGSPCALLMGPSYPWAPLGSLGHPSHPLHSPQGNACKHRPCCSSTDFPRPFAPELKKRVTFVTASILPLPPHSCLKNSPFPAAWDVFFFIAIVTTCKYLRLARF